MKDEFSRLLTKLQSIEFDPIRDCSNQIGQWLSDDCIDDSSKQEIVDLIQSANLNELRDRFYRELEFGTGGLRGIIGAGINRMNQYVIGRATQGLANYIVRYGNEAMTRGVAIAYDSRHFSKEFAEEAAAVLAANKINVHIFPTLNTTPCLSFAVRQLHAMAGICITASHNPAAYNGYKVYWEDGGQIIPPVDREILNEVFAVKSFSEIQKISFAEGVKQNLIRYISKTTMENYYQTVCKYQLYPAISKDISIVYTPLHGTGGPHAKELLHRWEYKNLFVVPEQAEPDGRFPTVRKPNPEETDALDLAFAHAERLNANIVLATDPDSDRLALAVRESEATRNLFKPQAHGNFVFLNGNQTAALLLDYIIQARKDRKELKSTDKLLKTIVTSELLKRIAENSGVETIDTLTGFKWIGGVMTSWDKDPKHKSTFLFACEESFGYITGDYVRDKDGLAALCQATEMVALLHSQGKTPCERLVELFHNFGAWQETLISVELFGESGATRIKTLMNTMRSNPKLTFGGIPVQAIIDYKDQSRKRIKDGKLELHENVVTLPPSEVIQFFLNDGSSISMRPSGTEPKIKFYISVCTKTGNVINDYKETLDRLRKLEEEIKQFVESSN